MKDVFIVSATRTAIGSFGGALKGVSPCDLGAHVTREAVKRSGVDVNTIQSNAVGHVIRTEVKDAYIARRIALEGGLPIHTQSLTLNRLCGSGLEAIVFISQQILLNEIGVGVAGGAESMSSAAHLLTTNRWGQAMGDGKIQDELVGALTDPFGVGHMGVTAENLSDKYQISREQQDQLSLQSQNRAAKAIEQRYFQEQIVPFEVKSKKTSQLFLEDEHPKPNTTLDGLAKLRTVFKDGGTVTAGNASGINDGASMVVLASGEEVDRQKLTPMARIVSYGRCGVANEIMGIGPVGATKIALAKAGLNISDMDVVESNEAFAAQALAVAKELEFDDNKTNPNGGAIALGHPIGASGAIILCKAIYELRRVGGKYALITMCIGGGQGIAVIVEAC